MRILILVVGILWTQLFALVTADAGVVSRSRTPSSYPPALVADLAVKTSAAARNDVVRVLAQFGAITRLCSGVMVAPRIAVTAGRCVHQGSGGDFALDYWVQPASDGTNTPFGQAFGTLLVTFSEWTDRSDPDYDIGFVVLDRALGDLSGYVSPKRVDGCGSYGGADLSWVGYVSTTNGQVAERGSVACATGSLTVTSASTFTAGTPLFAGDGRVHAVSSTGSGSQVQFTRFNSRVLDYFVNTLLATLESCDLELEADRVEFGSGSGEAMVSVYTGQGCAWSVEGTPPSWIEVLSGSGYSFGHPVFQVLANSGGARTATFTVGGKPFAVSQSEAGGASNSRFATSSTLGGMIISTTVDVTGVTRDPEAPSPGGSQGKGAWWRWTAPTTTLTTIAASADRFSASIGVYTGNRTAALSLVAEGRNTVSFTGVAGTTYVIFAAALSGGEGPMRLLVEQLFPGAEAQTGWWWNPDEPGRGIFLETNGGFSFLGWFGYDTNGSWLWHVTRGEILTRRYFQGGLGTFRYGQVLGGPFKKATFIGDSGSISLTFSSATRATLTSGTTTIPLQRFSFTTNGPKANRAPFVPETGWWWTPSEPGTGFALEVQGNQLMVGAFHYDADGSSRWSMAMGPMSDQRVFEGTFNSYIGGQALGQGYHPPTSTTETGRVTLLFSDASHAIALLPGGRQVVIERFKF